MREAFEEALRNNPDGVYADIVEDTADKLVQTESAHARHLSKVDQDVTAWRNVCDMWAVIGIDYGHTSTNRAAKQRARINLPSILEWEEEGTVHLLGRLEHGLRLVFRIEGTGISFGTLLEARETGIRPFDLPSQTFVEEFKDLVLSPSQGENLDQFLLEQRSGIEEKQVPVFGVGQTLPLVARWLRQQFENPDQQYPLIKK